MLSKNKNIHRYTIYIMVEFVMEIDRELKNFGNYSFEKSILMSTNNEDIKTEYTEFMVPPITISR